MILSHQTSLSERHHHPTSAAFTANVKCIGLLAYKVFGWTLGSGTPFLSHVLTVSCLSVRLQYVFEEDITFRAPCRTLCFKQSFPFHKLMESNPQKEILEDEIIWGFLRGEECSALMSGLIHSCDQCIKELMS